MVRMERKTKAKVGKRKQSEVVCKNKKEERGWKGKHGKKDRKTEREEDHPFLKKE